MERDTKVILNENLFERFPSKYPIKSFFNYVSNKVGLEGVLAVAGMLTPELIVEKDCVFLKENYHIIANNNLFEKYATDDRTLERYVNLFCISDFYMLASDEASNDQDLLFQFAKVLKYFWSIYLKDTFPERVFEIEIAEDGLFDEYGLCLTFSQVRTVIDLNGK
jgi:hypothetical protein